MEGSAIDGNDDTDGWVADCGIVVITVDIIAFISAKPTDDEDEEDEATDAKDDKFADVNEDDVGEISDECGEDRILVSFSNKFCWIWFSALFSCETITKYIYKINKIVL